MSRPWSWPRCGLSEMTPRTTSFSAIQRYGCTPSIDEERATMTDINHDEPPLFTFEEQDEQDPEEEVSFGGTLRLEGVEIPEDLQQFGNGNLPANLLTALGIGHHKLHPAAASAFARWRQEAATAGID